MIKIIITVMIDTESHNIASDIAEDICNEIENIKDNETEEINDVSWTIDTGRDVK